MTETFACPECGGELALIGATPGREVQCARCATWVEVPYLPRDGVWTRPRFRNRRPRWAIPLAWTAVGLFAAIVAIVAASKYVSSRGQADREATLREILRAADEAEAAGRADRSLSEVEAALALLRARGPEESGRIAELSGRRDRLSVREAEARLLAATGLDPAAAVGEILTLRARARQDRALDPLVSTILEALEAARRRQAEADVAAARKARDAGRALDALALGEHAMAVAEKLESASSIRAIAAEAESIMGPIVGRLGVIIAQETGLFTLGSPTAYEEAVAPMAVDALRNRGYAPRPAKGPSRAIWDRHAPFRLTLKVAETHEGLYLQSKSRVSQIVAFLTLMSRDRQLWNTQVTGRTQSPLPDLPAFVASRLAVSDRRDPDFERRFYENARASVLEQVRFKLRGLPPLAND